MDDWTPIGYLDYMEQTEEETQSRSDNSVDSVGAEVSQEGKPHLLFFVTPAIENRQKQSKNALALPSSLGYILSLADPTAFAFSVAIPTQHPPPRTPSAV